MHTKTRGQVVCALLPDARTAEGILQALEKIAVGKENVSLVANPEEFERKEFENVAGVKMRREALESGKKMGVAGAVLYGLTGTTAMAIAGTSLLAAGPIVAVLAAAGGLLGALIGAGFTENEASGIDEELRRGKTLVAVHLPEGVPTGDVERVLHEAGAGGVHVHKTSSRQGAV